MKIQAAKLSAVACSVVMGLQVWWMPVQAQAPQPPAQPAYPSAPPTRYQVNPARDAPARKADEPRCTNLKGLEKAECERRDTADDDAPAGVTSSMREKQKEKNNADTSADTANDTAKEKPSKAATDDANSKEAEKHEKAKTTADETDTLGKPPK